MREPEQAEMTSVGFTASCTVQAHILLYPAIHLIVFTLHSVSEVVVALVTGP